MADIAFSSIEKIVKVGFAIKEAVDKVRQNKEECQEIQKVVARVSAILSQLQQTNMLKGPAVDGALMGLEETLNRALKLVMEGQEGHVIRRFFTAGDMSKELRRMQDDISQKMMLGLFAVNVQATIILTNIQSDVAHPLSTQPQDVGVAETSQCSHSSIDDDVNRSQVNMKKSNALAGSEVSSPLLPAAGSKFFTLSELKNATCNFSEKNIIGKGGSCTVYKGVLHGGLVVAIKKLLSADYKEHEMNFIYNGPKLQHKNVVKCLGYGVEKNVNWIRLYKNITRAEKLPIWVEEFVPNGSLEKFLINGRQLDWSCCFRIIHGIVLGLHWLHEQHIVHRDVKPSNILLESDMNPKISDLGLARALRGMDTEEFENIIIGTTTYLDPLYVTTGSLSLKCDVYSFGVTLLEIVRDICQPKPRPDDTHPTKWAWAVFQDGQTKNLFDPSFCDESQQEEIKRCVEIGLLCTEYDRDNRPTMQDVLNMLNGEKEVPTPTVRGR